MKTKTLIPATIIALALIAAACGSGGDSDNVSTFNPAPEATVSVETVPETTEVLRERVPTTEVPEAAPTTEVPVVTEAVPTTEATTTTVTPTTTTLPPEPPNRDNLRGFDIIYPINPNIKLSQVSSFGSIATYGGWDIGANPDGTDQYYFDARTLPENTGFKIVDGKKFFYLREKDEYYECWEIMGESSIVTENGYCHGGTFPSLLFIDSDGYFVGTGIVYKDYLATASNGAVPFISDIQTNDNIEHQRPVYEIPEVLPPSSKLVLLHLRYVDEFIMIPCEDVGSRWTEIQPPGNYNLDDQRIKLIETFWIHADGVCRNGFGGYVNEETGEYIITRLCKGIVVDYYACDYEGRPATTS